VKSFFWILWFQTKSLFLFVTSLRENVFEYFAVGSNPWNNFPEIISSSSLNSPENRFLENFFSYVIPKGKTCGKLKQSNTIRNWKEIITSEHPICTMLLKISIDPVIYLFIIHYYLFFRPNEIQMFSQRPYHILYTPTKPEPAST